MAQEYRYPLTRVCLRGGTMTLPRAMLGLFPESGEVVVLDTVANVEYRLEISHPRVVAGLGPLFRAHALDVHDELVVARRDDGRYALTPVQRPRPAPPDRAEAAPGHGAAEGAGAEAAADAAEPTPGFAAGRSPQADVPAADGAFNLDPRAAVAEAESALAELEGAERPARPAPAQAPTHVAPTHVAPTDAVPSHAVPTRGAPASAPARAGAAAEEDEHAAALAAVALSSRLRRTFGPLGFRTEPLARGVVYLHAAMGRRHYRVLVQLLRSGERLDWAGLLARRRASPANYLAVVGDRSDLLRLTSPADLARATLWSWEALERLLVLHASASVTPIDLESHFGRDGMFEQGLKRFEQGAAARVAERGATSEVLTRLAVLGAPTVFLLEDLAQDLGMSRDAVLRILERLAEAPFHLVGKVDNGEFLLRQPVADALANLASYAESLRQRLPLRRREVIAGLDDPEEEAADDGAAAGADAAALSEPG